MINLIEAEHPRTPTEEFFAEFMQDSQENWLNPRQRIVGMAGIEMSPSIYDHQSGVHINDIVSYKTGEGHGSVALRRIIDLADKHGVTLDLIAKTYTKDRLSTKQLVDWYARHGFVRKRGSASDGYEMVRKPKGAVMAKEPSVKADHDNDGPVRIKLRGWPERNH